MTNPQLPLSGVRVIDVTRALAGPFCTMLLGDQGADVIKIERPGRGDDTRHQSNPRIDGENTAYLAVNRNKRSVTLNLQNPDGIEIARRFISESDVFVENFRPGKAEELGLGYEDLARINPRLIYCSLSGWGADGPSAHKGGYAATAEAVAGLMSVTGEAGGPPAKIGISLIDNLTGLYAKDAITAALLLRERTGVGQKVDTSLLESAVSVLSMTASAFLLGGAVAKRLGSEHEWNVPWKAFQTLDGHVMVACSSEGQWRHICNALEVPDLAVDPRFTTLQLRGQNRQELYRIMDGILADQGTDHWLKRFDVEGAAAAPINTIDQVFQDPQVLHRGMVQHVHHESLGEIAQIGHAQKFSASPSSIRLPPPLLGRHTDEVLATLADFSVSDIASLRERGVV